jgi:acetyltransferase
LAQLDEKTVEAMRERLPSTAVLHNPVDLIGDAQHDRYQVALEAVVKDLNVDSILTLATPQAMTDLEEIARVVGRIAGRSDKPIVACFMGVMDVSASVQVLGEERVPHYRFPEAAVRAVAAMSRYREWIHRPRTTVKTFPVDRGSAEAVIRQAQEEGRCSLSPSESLEVLRAYGFPLPPFGAVRTAPEAVVLAEQIGFPVVMKILSPDILHKVDVGGVRLNLRTPDEVKWAFEEMLQTVARRRPEARLDGVLIQQMVPRGTEMILGMKRDRQFGPVLMFGLGGIYVEVLKDVTFRLAPVRELGALHMIRSIRASKILRGFRGEPPADIPHLVECVERLSQLSMELQMIEELDINPLMAYPQGQGAKVADARVLLHPTP